MTTFSFSSLTEGRAGLPGRGTGEMGVDDVFVAAPTAVDQENVGVVGRS